MNYSGKTGAIHGIGLIDLQKILLSAKFRVTYHPDWMQSSRRSLTDSFSENWCARHWPLPFGLVDAFCCLNRILPDAKKLLHLCANRSLLKCIAAELQAV